MEILNAFFNGYFKQKTAETGRSMVEILGVLAVIGVLSIGGIYGYAYAMKKYTANLLVQEAHLAWANNQGNPEATETNWIPVNFTPKCGYNMFTGKDEDGDTFVLVENIDKEMCQMLMQLGNNDALSFYQQVELEETNIALVTECNPEPMDIIFAFEGIRAPGKDCETNEECADSAGGYCHADMGICYDCPDGKEPNESRTFCNPICDTEIESECWSGEYRWCCGGNTICGETVNECPESDGFCKYQFENMEMKAKADCSYQVSADEMILSTNCSYNVSGDVVTGEWVIEESGCLAGQYCYLSFTNKNCTNLAKANHTGTLYGVCTSRDTIEPSCPLNFTKGKEMVEAIDDPCPFNQYCLLSFSTETCTQTLNVSQTGVIYGVCTDKDNNTSSSCKTDTPDWEKMLSVQTDCPKQQYCYLAFKSKGCTDMADAKGSNPLWGVCLDRDYKLSDLEECPIVE